MKGLHDFLVSCIHHVVWMDNKFRQYISTMIDKGVPVEECEIFMNEYYQVDAANLKAIVSNLTDRDLKQINEYRKHLVAQMQAIRVSPPTIRWDTPSQTFQRVNKEKELWQVSSAPNYQDYAAQANAIRSLMDFLVDECKELVRTVNLYYKMIEIERLKEDGIPRQTAEHYYLNFAQPNINMFKKTITHIQEDYDHLMGLFTALVSSNMIYVNSPKPMVNINFN